MLCPIYDETLVVYNTKPLRISNWLILIEQVLNDLRNRLCFLDYCQNVVKLCNILYISLFLQKFESLQYTRFISNAAIGSPVSILPTFDGRPDGWCILAILYYKN